MYITPRGGIIPARAGFTDGSDMSHRVAWDHPRSRGVYNILVRIIVVNVGSSPLARGLQDAGKALTDRTGIIPARAGFTLLGCSPDGLPEDHPRSRGVYVMKNALEKGEEGSSPLARGLQNDEHRHYDHQRIIPARAGFTASRAS